MKLTLKRTEWLISATVFFTNPWTSLERTPTTSSQDRRCPKKLTTPISRIHSFLQQCQVTAPKLRLFASGCMEWFDFLNCRQKIGARATLCNSSCVLKLKHWCVWVCVSQVCCLSPQANVEKNLCQVKGPSGETTRVQGSQLLSKCKLRCGNANAISKWQQKYCSVRILSLQLQTSKCFCGKASKIWTTSTELPDFGNPINS